MGMPRVRAAAELRGDFYEDTGLRDGLGRGPQNDVPAVARTTDPLGLWRGRRRPSQRQPLAYWRSLSGGVLTDIMVGARHGTVTGAAVATASLPDPKR